MEQRRLFLIRELFRSLSMGYRSWNGRFRDVTTAAEGANIRAWESDWIQALTKAQITESMFLQAMGALDSRFKDGPPDRGQFVAFCETFRPLVPKLPAPRDVKDRRGEIAVLLRTMRESRVRRYRTCLGGEIKEIEL
jgi:hypothetical protein